MDEFRDEMLKDNRLRQIIDYPEAIDCFPGVQIKGGVCYFLWERENKGLCKVSTSRKGEIVSEMTRPLLEKGSETFVRYNEAISILKKVQKWNEPSISNWVSSRKPFGLSTTYKGGKQEFENSIMLYQNGGIGFIGRTEIEKNSHLVDRFKVLIPRAGSGSDSFPHSILGKPFTVLPNSACTETYLVLKDFDSENECINLRSYVSTKFFRFLVLLIKSTQDATSRVYSFVPIQNFSESWNDEKLYKKYGIIEEEQQFIDSLIRPMDLNNSEEGDE
jgi:site-specific DNA-methyltransferase (adenine-specific)